ncbi:transposable element Tcb2 transposase [Trichonephila clavipes]|uniref:Transposable element Tcb2 transposase n=1 Tax=Trichonephila clavipes TaxID=2585209 RepID=A0A8X6RL92_TRICX|nr:transposable element Tcb2 transposase [Trichonephila clavipes]
MTTQRYVHDILQPHVLPLMQRLPGAISQLDSSRLHTVRVSQYCFLTVTTLSWPSRSLDLSPIEHIWDSFRRRFGHPTSLNELEARTATAGSDVVQSGRPIFDDFFQHLWPHIGNNTANVVFQMVKRLWLILIDQ